MEFDDIHIIIDNHFNRMLHDDMHPYVAHAYCSTGKCLMKYNEQDFIFQQGDLMILPTMRLVQSITPDDGFCVTVIYVHTDFRTLCIPNSNYGVRGGMALINNPIMSLQPWEQDVCQWDINNICFRHAGERNEFYTDIMVNAVQALILDCYQFHAHRNTGKQISTYHADIMSKFINLLEEGAYREHRDLGYYASELCITAKYFSNLCKRISGHSASLLINRYTTLEIRRLLKDTTLSIAEISERLHFSSPSHFSLFFYKQTGVLPSDYRK